MRGTPFGFSAWHKGLNTIDSPFTLEEGETRECMNVVSTERGAIRKRTGSSTFSKENTETEMLALGRVKVEAGEFLIVSNGVKVWSMDTSGKLTLISGAKSFTSGNWCIVQAPKGRKKTAGPVYLTNGKDKAQYWSGAAAGTELKEWEGEKTAFEGKEMYQTAPFVPQGKFMIYAQSRMWMANVSGDESLVAFSELTKEGVTGGGEENDPTLWPKENFFRLDSEDNLPITGIGTCGPYIIIFKANKTFILHGVEYAKPNFRKLSNNIGCISHRSIVDTPGGCYFLTPEQGIYNTNGSRLTEMSYKVRPTILKINGTNREKAAGAFFNNHYYLSFPFETTTTPNRTLDYDVILKSWWLHDLAGNQWAQFEPATGEPFLFTIPRKTTAIKSPGVVKAFVPELFTDSGNAYVGINGFSAQWVSPWEPFFYFIFRHRVKAPFVKKRVRQFFLNGSGEIIPLNYKNYGVAPDQIPAVVGNNSMNKPELPFKFATGSEKWEEGSGKWEEGTELWGGKSGTGFARAYSLGTANVWCFGFASPSNSKEPFELFQATYMIQFRKS